MSQRVQLHAEVVLQSLPGAVEFLRQDVSAVPAVSAVRTGPDYLLARVDGPIGGLADLRTYASLGLVLGPAAEGGPATVVASLQTLTGQLAALAGVDPPLRFRVGSSVPDRGRVIEAIREQLGWPNDPSSWQVNLEVVAGTVVAQVGAMFLTQRLGALTRLPASTTPIIAEVMVRLAKLPPGAAVLDAFCGAGTILLTAGAGPATPPSAQPGGPPPAGPGGPRPAAPPRLVGLDRDHRALAAARDNLRRRGLTGLLARTDARQLPVADLSIDRLVSNLPFGKRVGSHRTNEELYPRFLREAERVLAPRGRMVLLSEDKALLRVAVQRTQRVKIIREVLLRSGGGTPTAFVVERTRPPRRRTGGRASA